MKIRRLNLREGMIAATMLGMGALIAKTAIPAPTILKSVETIKDDALRITRGDSIKGEKLRKAKIGNRKAVIIDYDKDRSMAVSCEVHQPGQAPKSASIASRVGTFNYSGMFFANNNKFCWQELGVGYSEDDFTDKNFNAAGKRAYRDSEVSCQKLKVIVEEICDFVNLIWEV